MPRQLLSKSFLDASGTVTAELALALPTVSLVVAVTLSGFGLQIERMKFVSVAASAARAIGRGETVQTVEDLVRHMAPGSKVRLEYLENEVCANVSEAFALIGVREFEVSERQCARKMGL